MTKNTKKTNKISKLTDGQLSIDDLIIKYRLDALKIAKSLAKKWNYWVDYQELQSVVDLSLCEAAKNFDELKGASFLTFLYYYLKGNMIKLIKATSNIQYVSIDEVDLDYISNSLASTNSSLDNLQPDTILIKKELASLSNKVVANLDYFQQEVIKNFYSEQKTITQLASDLGYSRGHVMRIKSQTLGNIKEVFDDLLSLNSEISSKALNKKRASSSINRKIKKAA